MALTAPFSPLLRLFQAPGPLLLPHSFSPPLLSLFHHRGFLCVDDLMGPLSKVGAACAGQAGQAGQAGRSLPWDLARPAARSLLPTQRPSNRFHLNLTLLKY